MLDANTPFRLDRGQPPTLVAYHERMVDHGMANWPLVLTLAALLAATQVVLGLLARALGHRLDRAALLVGLALPWLLLAPWLSPDRILVPTGPLSRIPGTTATAEPSSPHDIFNDIVYQFMPWEVEVRRELGRGRLPLWSDLIGGGATLWSNPQAGVLSPVSMLARAAPVENFLLVTLALKLLVAAQGAWLLARSVGASRAAAVLAAIAFSLGGGILAWSLFNNSQAAAWVPWVCSGAIRLVRRPSVAAVAATAAVTAALLLSGHPETAAFGGAFATGCALVLRRRTASWRGIAHAAAAAALGFALAAPLLVPFACLLPTTARARETLATSRLDRAPRLLVPATWFHQFRGPTWIAPTNPEAFGRPYRDPFRGHISWPVALAGYSGLLAFGGALAGFVARGQRARLFVFGAVGILLLVSQPIPLLRVLWLVPPLRTVAWDRAGMIAALAIAVAGALGVDALCRGRRLTPWIGLASATALSVVVDRSPRVIALWLGCWVALACCRVLRRSSRLPGVGTLLLVAVSLADLLPWARWQLPEGKRELFYPPNPLVEVARKEVEADGPWRAVGQDFLLYPSLLGVYGVADVRPHDPVAHADQLAILGAGFDFAPTMHRYFAPFRRPDQPLLDFLNVRVVVSNRNLAEPRGMQRVDHGELGVFSVWRNPDALPRWFLASGVDPVARNDLPAWVGRMTDPRRVAVAPHELSGWAASNHDPAGGPLLPLEQRPGRLVLAIPDGASGDRILATSFSHPEGWTARDGAGRPLRGLTVNGAYFGAVVPARVDRVTLRFRPPGLGAGLLLGLAGAMGLAWTSILALRQRLRRARITP